MGSDSWFPKTDIATNTSLYPPTQSGIVNVALWGGFSRWRPFPFFHPLGPSIYDVRKIFRILDPPSPLCPQFTQPISTVRPQNQPSLWPLVRTYKWMAPFLFPQGRIKIEGVALGWLRQIRDTHPRYKGCGRCNPLGYTSWGQRIVSRGYRRSCLQWHSIEQFGYSDTFLISQFPSLIVKFSWLQWHSISHSLTVTLFARSQGCHWNRLLL